MENDFLTAFNRKKQNQAEPGTVVRPFIGEPQNLPLAQRQELIYKYSYLEESIESLALHYQLTPTRLTQWFSDNNITRKQLLSDDDIQEFEKKVTEIYKSIQTRLIGLTVLHSAKAWESLALTEENLLASLENATSSVSQQEIPDHRTLASLAATHEKIVNRHTIIQEGLNKAKETGGLFQAITRIERIIVTPDLQQQEETDGEDTSNTDS